MEPDDLKQTWQSQPAQARLSVEAELLLKELQRNQQTFNATIFWRDVHEVGTAILIVPLWIYLGVKLSLPWTWYLVVPGMLWVAGFRMANRMRHQRQPPGPGEPLRQCVESSLALVEHQIWLLRNVLWWYLLPLCLPVLAFIGQVAWLRRSDGWPAAFAMSFVLAVVVITFVGIYWLNMQAVRSRLEPRRQELEALLTSLEEETQQ